MMNWQVRYSTLLDINVIFKRKFHHSSVDTRNYSKQHNLCLNEIDLMGLVY